MVAGSQNDGRLPRRAAEIIEALKLSPHPEGGWFAETFRESAADGRRGTVTQIYYLLAAGELSAWHRVTDATEIWHHYNGAPLQLSLADEAEGRRVVILGKDIQKGEQLNAVVPLGCWQAAQSLGVWTLVGCTVAPAFEFAGFEMAPVGWEPQ